VTHLRALLATTILILACASPGAIVNAATSATAPARSATAALTAKAAGRSSTKRRRRSHSACRASRRWHKRRLHCRSHSTRRGGSRAARYRSAARRTHADRRPSVLTHGALTQTISLASESSPSIASVLSTPCTNTGLAPEPGNLEEVRTATLCLVNQERARNGELPLRPNAQLEQAAQGHSDEMVSKNYFSHVAPNGLTPTSRIEAAGYIPGPQIGYTLGENIAWGTGYLATPSAIVAAWIASPEHIANILYGQYHDTAIGVVPAVPPSLAQGQAGAVYTQEFGVIVR
jgi:uncharacterized protein YkwD